MTEATIELAPGSNVLALSPGEAAAFAAVADRLVTAHPHVDEALVAGARSAWDDLPVGTRRRIRAFRRDSGVSGVLVVRGLPLDVELPPTPSVGGSVQRTTTRAAAVLLLVACGLGDPAAYRQEKGGALVQDVVPVPGQEAFQGNAGSTELMLHNENAFHDHRPDYVLLLCLRADHDRVAGLHTSSVREALGLLPATTRALLGRPVFRTAAPPSFGFDSAGTPEQAVLTGDAEDPDVRVDFAATTAVTPDGQAALDELNRVLEAVARTRRLEPGVLAIVDNHVTLHGRSAFRPRYDGADRWLQRTFVLNDLRRSRDHRPGDGHVLER
ncbi:TauD/TfdA family dioxygenase [Amycolatopsis minnesotensis]|uniref:Clavaminate synthase family protein n=1 Tax=Amycolatopsis minnesotensis TaxID=337894 RepID=A0ABN2PXQ8_9PSEU